LGFISLKFNFFRDFLVFGSRYFYILVGQSGFLGGIWVKNDICRRSAPAENKILGTDQGVLPRIT